ncbi:FRIH2 [Enterospora canceri]|uniref:Ferritin n=1 Tax=Enterospora canceri TaxID=1081671 RepID=A0A1Y1S935_9MICR|nr:FRIH2 [Enterospora canceri]
MSRSQRVAGMLNEAVALEHKAWYYYTLVAGMMDRSAYPNLSVWFRKEALDELEHAQIVISFINRLNTPLRFPDIGRPVLDESDQLVIDAFRKAVEFEQIVLGHYSKMAAVADEEGDLVVAEFCDQFLRLQIKEVKSFRDHLRNAERCKREADTFVFDQSFGK